MSFNFAEVRRAAPDIYVSDSDGHPSLLKPGKNDDQETDHRVSEGTEDNDRTMGDGSRDNPYRCRGASSVSPHYMIVDLWSRFREETAFIQVNRWLLETSFDGVTSSDGHFTKLTL